MSKQSASTGLTQCGAATNMSNRRYSQRVWDMTLSVLSNAGIVLTTSPTMTLRHIESARLMPIALTL